MAFREKLVRKCTSSSMEKSKFLEALMVLKLWLLWKLQQCLEKSGIWESPCKSLSPLFVIKGQPKVIKYPNVYSFIKSLMFCRKYRTIKDVHVSFTFYSFSQKNRQKSRSCSSVLEPRLVPGLQMMLNRCWIYMHTSKWTKSRRVL